MGMLAKHPAAETSGLAFIGGILVISVHQRPGVTLAQVFSWRLQDGGGIRFSSFEVPGIGIRASTPGTRALDRSRSVSRL